MPPNADTTYRVTIEEFQGGKLVRSCIGQAEAEKDAESCVSTPADVQRALKRSIGSSVVPFIAADTFADTPCATLIDAAIADYDSNFIGDMFANAVRSLRLAVLPLKHDCHPDDDVLVVVRANAVDPKRFDDQRGEMEMMSNPRLAVVDEKTFDRLESAARMKDRQISF